MAASAARSEAVRQAKRKTGLNAEIKANTARITGLVEISDAAPLLQETGFGPVTAAIRLTAWSHHRRLRSEAAFDSLAGVSPIPASSGNTIRHRLNRGGDRSLDKALHVVALSRWEFLNRARWQGRPPRRRRARLHQQLATTNVRHGQGAPFAH